MTKFQKNSTVHRNTVKRLRANGSPELFETLIPQANQFAAAAEYGGKMTLKQKWGYHNLAQSFEEITREVIEVLEG